MIGLRNFDPKTDIESWIMPVLMGLITAVNLDLKVVISEGSVPLITEANELHETIWLDGAHAAIRAIIDIGRRSASDRLHVDEVVPALCRLAAAYLIHLDSEYKPPKEEWQRFPPIGHSLAESPLYVFHHLLKQERDDPEKKALTRDRVLRYIGYANLLSGNRKDNNLMTIARDLVQTYRKFYRADNFKNSNSILRPINVVADALLSASAIPAYRDRDMLVEIAHGELYKFMDRVAKGLADGRFPKGITVDERADAMRAFCTMFVDALFYKTYGGDAAALRGKPINLLKNACEVIYREAQYAEWAERGRDAEEIVEDDGAAS
jgi:CRISPR-associated protein Csc3